MSPMEMNDTCKDAFIELVFQSSKYQGRTFCYFHPFRGKKPTYHITIADKETGYAVVVPLTPKTAMMLEKDSLKDLYNGILEGLLLAVDKHKEEAKPVDYRRYPIKSQGRLSVFENVFEKGIGPEEKVSVEVYGWSKIISG